MIALLTEFSNLFQKIVAPLKFLKSKRAWQGIVLYYIIVFLLHNKYNNVFLQKKSSDSNIPHVTNLKVHQFTEHLCRKWFKATKFIVFEVLGMKGQYFQ